MNRYQRRNLFLGIILVLLILAVASGFLAVMNQQNNESNSGDVPTETIEPTRTPISTSGANIDSSDGEGLPDDQGSQDANATSTSVVFVPGSGGGSGSGAGSGSGSGSNPTPDPSIDNGTVFYPVWDCVYAGDQTWVWVAADVTYSDGVPVSSEVLSGPHAGGFQPGCPPADD